MLPGPSPAAGWKLRAVVALVAGLVTSAPSLAVAPSDVAAAVRSRRVFLWEVARRDDSTPKLYLLGATHVGRRAIVHLDPVIETAFSRSDVLAVEANVLEVDARRFQQFMLAKGTLHDGSTLSQWIPSPLNDELQAALAVRRNLETAYERRKPWFVSLTLSADEFARSGYRREFGTEGYFMRRAAGEKRIEELEGARRQIEILDALPRDAQVAMLDQTLRGLAASAHRAREIQELWEAGDADGMATLLFDSDPDPALARFRERMYFARNRAMTRRLERALAEPGVWFAVVGAAHLVGEHGIPRALAQAGYRVAQLEATEPVELSADVSAN